MKSDRTKNFLCWAIVLQFAVITLMGWIIYSDRAARLAENSQSPLVSEQTDRQTVGRRNSTPAPKIIPATPEVAMDSATSRPASALSSPGVVSNSYQPVSAASLPRGASPFLRRTTAPSLPGVGPTPQAPALAVVVSQPNNGALIAQSGGASSLGVAPNGRVNPTAATAIPAGANGKPVAAGAQAGAAANESETAPAIDIPLPDAVNSVPAAFEEADPEIAADPESRGRLTEIQEEFVEEIGGSARDTTRPDDGPIWKNAQWLADQKYRAQFGHSAFLAQQERAAAALARELENQ